LSSFLTLLKGKFVNNKEILEEMKQYFKVKSIEEVALKLGYKEKTASTWRSRGVSDAVYNKFKIIKSNDYINPQERVNRPSNNTNIISIPKLSIKASAGYGNNLECIDTFKSGEVIHVDKSLFKTPPKNIKAIQVDGYSMLPMLLPDSWVFFDETSSYCGEGLYVLNLDNELIVKLLQKNPINGIIKIISVNKNYESYEYDSNTSDVVFRIVGKVVRVMI
jgi:phage repressor protein C with HTH and peptisase S24 domain